MTPTIQYRKTLYLPESVLQQWEAYSVTHPEQSFNGLIVHLLKEHLCVNDVQTLTTK